VIAFEFESDTEAEPYRVLFNEEKLRESANFRELALMDFPLDELLSRRRDTRFGSINRPE
jgi:hypothetical protein